MVVVVVGGGGGGARERCIDLVVRLGGIKHKKLP